MFSPRVTFNFRGAHAHSKIEYESRFGKEGSTSTSEERTHTHIYVHTNVFLLISLRPPQIPLVAFVERLHTVHLVEQKIKSRYTRFIISLNKHRAIYFVYYSAVFSFALNMDRAVSFSQSLSRSGRSECTEKEACLCLPRRREKKTRKHVVWWLQYVNM